MQSLPNAEILSVRSLEAPRAGFAGPNHTAVSVIAGDDFAQTNPFILMMDDRLAGQGAVGEEHPHAGLETVTFIVRGRYRDVEGELHAGDLSWMTAGRGIIHSEHSQSFDDMRLLQVWLTLADGERDIPPRVQTLRKDAVPVHRDAGVVAHLYSGRSGELSAATVNSVPATVMDIALESGAAYEQQVEAGYNGFVYALEGNGVLGAPGTPVEANQIAWLKPAEDARLLRIRAGERGLRLIFLAGQSQRNGIVAQGPFVADTREQLQRQAADYREGRFTRSSTLRGVA